MPIDLHRAGAAVPIVGELHLDYLTLRRITQASIKAQIWLIRVFGLLLLVCTAMPVLSGASLSTLAAGITLGALLLLLPELAPAIGWSRLRRVAAAAPFQYEVSDRGVTIRTAQSTAELTWDAIGSVRSRRYVWLVRSRLTGRSLVLPRAAFSGEDQSALDELLRARNAGRSASA